MYGYAVPGFIGVDLCVCGGFVGRTFRSDDYCV